MGAERMGGLEVRLGAGGRDLGAMRTEKEGMLLLYAKLSSLSAIGQGQL